MTTPGSLLPAPCSVLAFDTCFNACSVAVRWRSQRGEWLLREEYEERQSGHAEALMPMMERVLEGAGLPFDRLERIAVTLGPGTFTGTRIGVATARGLALATGLPVVGMTSLAVMAARADLQLGKQREGRRLAVAVDARRGEVYLQLFGENAGDVLIEPLALQIEAAAGLLAAAPTLVVGSGAEAVVRAAQAKGLTLEAALPRLEPHARFLAILAPVLAPLDHMRPLYLRPADARPPASAPPA